MVAPYFWKKKKLNFNIFEKSPNFYLSYLFWIRPEDENLKDGAETIESLTEQAEKRAEETQELVQQVKIITLRNHL